MFKFEYGGRSMKVWFRHGVVVPSELPEWVENPAPADEYRMTTCFISDLAHKQPSDPILSGKSVCSPKDVFTRSTGRKRALSRAIEGFSKQQRAKIWLAYHKKCCNLKTLRSIGKQAAKAEKQAADRAKK